ncbi:acetyl-CoA carboxylase biotin carboxylase subunit [Ferviditalea candida]|uniref:biotin carboxylase n=1 Tax=Ferviditalea candida TaxID=3108399 RepID=A0ABU5ZKE2_9BACL|nr:acetyl-CoA carboxylase biotin carboxylase subunit [Paenibacillaceae bacterium T2]
MKYFDRVLIANRGEIARRIIRTCKRLGIQTVSVYSEADAELPFVKEADEAVPIGQSQAKMSYLDIEKILDAAKQTNAQAIHPGYGFLSENPAFAKRCEEEGIVFIGPRSSMIQAMGSKIEARRLMQAAGVPVVPGYDGKIDTVEEALRIAESLGYPLMLKASAGGGGIGMQLVSSAEELQKVYSSTIQRANSYFGDGTVFLEKFIENPRHIEVQVVCDHHGNAIHLFERECSVQRRNQKVIEESPSPFLTGEDRRKLCETAVQGIKNIGYTNVGTMEFIFGNDHSFYFLEMNTRLQVEHPVTEAVTGLDLVELQLKIAAGEQLAIKQEDVKQNGHAVESRLYAEDPLTYFPSPGKINRLTFPGQDVRLDFAVVEGNTVSPFYDPMIGKIITHGSTREEALQKMERSLTELDVDGITTNLPLLIQVLQNRDFQQGNYTTQLLNKMGNGGIGIVKG